MYLQQSHRLVLNSSLLQTMHVPKSEFHRMASIPVAAASLLQIGEVVWGMCLQQSHPLEISTGLLRTIKAPRLEFHQTASIPSAATNLLQIGAVVWGTSSQPLRQGANQSLTTVCMSQSRNEEATPS